MGPSYTPIPYDGGESTSTYTSCFAYSGRLFDYSDGTTPIHCQQARQSSSTYVCQAQITQQQAVGPIRAFLPTMPYDGGDSVPDRYPPFFAYSGRLFDYSDGTTPIHCQQARQSSSTYPSLARRSPSHPKSDTQTFTP